MAKEDRAEAQATENKRRDKQAEIAGLWYKGNNKADIIKKTGYPAVEVERLLRAIKKGLTPKTEKVLQYRKNKVLSKIDLVQRMAWQIAEDKKGKALGGDTIALAALRVVTSSQELEAKIEGVTQERLVVGPEQEASKLLSDVLGLEKKAKVVPAETEQDGEKTTPVPDFLKDMEEEA